LILFGGTTFLPKIFGGTAFPRVPLDYTIGAKYELSLLPLEEKVWAKGLKAILN